MTADPRLDPRDPDSERYAAGRMKESEELAFETRMMEDPALAKEVEAIQGIRQGFRVLAERDQLPQARRPGRLNPLFAVAAVLVVSVLGALVMLTFRSAPALTGKRIQGVTHTVFLTQTRGPELVTDIPGAGVTEVRILPGLAGETDRYQAMLALASDGVAVASNVDVRADRSGYVALYLDAHRLNPGIYTLSLVQGPREDRFSLRVLSAK
jgi:hypothetical protein